MNYNRFPVFALASICLASLALRLYLMPSSAVSASDEVTYVSVAVTLVRDHFVPLPLADFYVSSSGGYFFADKPPLLMYLLAASFSIFGDSLEVGRTAVIVVSITGILGVFALGRELYSTYVGLTSALIFAFFPVNVIIGSWITPTPLDASFISFALYFLVRYLLRGANFGYLVLFTLVSFLIEEWGALVIASLILASLLFFRDTKTFNLRHFVGILVAVSPVLILAVISSIIVGGTFYVSNNVNSGSFFTFLPGDIVALGAQLTEPGIIPSFIGLFTIVGLVSSLVNRSSSDKLLIVIAISSVATLIFGTALSGGLYASTGRYLIILTPVVSVLCATGIRTLILFLNRIGAG